MSKKFSQVLEESGIPLSFQACGTAPEKVLDREEHREPCPRAKKLRDLYYQTYSSATNEFPYWYTRKYMELDNEIPVVRRALARAHRPRRRRGASRRSAPGSSPARAESPGKKSD